MPTYQYTCTDCGEPLEVVQKFTDTALTECPNCGGNLRKVFSAVGVVFKGSGFYRTDSRSPAAASNGSSNGSSAESSNGASAGTGDGASGSSSGASSGSSSSDSSKNSPSTSGAKKSTAAGSAA